MKVQRNSLALTATIVAALGFACGTPQEPAIDLASLAPAADSVQGWNLDIEPETYVGEDLFQLINGGAEMYHEIGFSRVLSAEYADPDQRYITLELFEMADAGAAYGVYSFKIGSGGETASVGSAGVLDGYYMNFWKGPYVVTLTGMDDDPETRDGILAIATAVDDLLKADNAAAPSIATELARHSDQPDRVKYFRGDLALSNALPITGGLGFGMNEGAVANAGEHQLAVLSYTDATEAHNRLDAATQKLVAGGDFKLVDGTAEGEYRLVANDEKAFYLMVRGTRVFGVYGPAGSDADALMESMTEGS
ncbi:MAG: hypothetical protein GY906_05970 [bacterium]|nr:hypothetical protein [bacterium]